MVDMKVPLRHVATQDRFQELDIQAQLVQENELANHMN